MFKLNPGILVTLTVLIIATTAFSENPQLEKLKAARNKAIEVEKEKFEKAKQKINDYYLKKLEVLMTTYTKKGDLDTALEIKAEIGAIKNVMPVNVSSQKYKNAMKLKLGDEIKSDKVKIVNKNITIFANFISQDDNGVILAHGGKGRGYALYLNNGKVILASRSDGKLTKVESKPIKKRTAVVVEAVIKKDGTLSLKVNNHSTVSKKAPPFDKQPGESLSVGKDARGTYQSESFNGTIKQLLLQLD